MKKIDFAKFYSFCSQCGAQLGRRRENLMVCLNSHHVYINPKITNAVIFENKLNQIMLVRRKYPPYAGMWDLPGGFVDLHENMEESTAREIREELGVDVAELEYLSSSHDFYEYQGVIHPTICIIFKAAAPDESEMRVTDDVDGYKYFDKDLIPFEEIGFPSMRRVIEKYVAQLNR